jgi:AraC-like DNA-binding protein
MSLNEQDIKNIQNLVGNITEDNLKYVDAYISEKLGIFIPSVGFCEYAIKPNHTHPSYSFIIFFSENQNMIDVKVEVPSNCYLISAMSPEICHEEEKSDTFNRYIAIFIDKDFFDNQYAIYDLNKPKNYFWDQFIIRKDILSFIKKFMSEYEESSFGKEKLLHSLSIIITHELIRSILNLEAVKDIVIKKDEIQITINYMNQNFREKITIESLSKLANMSESNFNRIFKKETGISPIDYLINVRIKKAKKFLREKTNTITEISMNCGFYSISHFSSCFMKQFGMSPSDYQNLFNK